MEQIKAEIKKTRKFKDFEYYESSKQNEYYLLPFRFYRINEQKEVLVNEIGDFLIVPSGTAEKVITKTINPEIDKELYADLVANFFISEDRIPPLIDIAAARYRTKKYFLDGFTTLHIFVISLRCEHTCHYCQVSRVTTNKTTYDMGRTHIDKGIEYMMMSPSVNLTMEFQGGEALLAFENIQYAIEKANMLAQQLNKNMTYVICTNLALLNDEILNYCKTENILISTSLDGPAFIHNANRHRPENNSYELTIEGIEKCRASLGEDKVSALLTTTTLSLDYPTEIVDEYFNKSFKSIFLRPISPYGFAKHNDKKNGYLTDRFLTFYKTALNRIIKYNMEGHFFREEYATIILKKILSPFPVGYVDLQSPAGMINKVIVFNYDGKVYASDEARMLAENHDYTFCLGNLDENTYNDIFFNENVSHISDVMVNEALAGCSECAFQAYCGADPVFHYATQGDMYGNRADSLFCRKNMEIIRYLLELMDNNKNIEKIFYN
ncbi:His-Xaa-Ser system radical SAM maturase HxsB [Arachidicoccus rhizosphaerae]|uniref:His-Xaa-Ser system radical SAM maturase HxsB n=1 Tax=Arachidicoccus rhizosphaerae TaxID=551991 RepID=A0A1H3VIM2_9BACT|nr:His-Xaa-Ser system radical SAM maturase HxsB [Arachidicoccus rhizosphaerae]SDZ74637.1 His-Xaa-Ser system radical SAM maturase HxsB [Arachidicoccus rhizosphaerae]